MAKGASYEVNITSPLFDTFVEKIQITKKPPPLLIEIVN